MNQQSLFFLGIGGIGMSALAKYFSHEGYKVCGYDRDETPVTRQLEDMGISIYHELDDTWSEMNINRVIYTPAIKEDHKEYRFFSDKATPMLKRSEALKEILSKRKVIAVAGTHGKTSTSAILAHILTSNNFGATAFVGGIMSNYQSNFIHGEGPWVIIEADEYDRSFWRLYPDIALIQAMDADHLDIYGSEEQMIEGYRVFTSQIKPNGILLVSDKAIDKISEDWQAELLVNAVNISTFGVDQGALSIEYLQIKGHHSSFHLEEGGPLFNLGIAGAHNLQNALGAISIARHLGLNDTQIANAIGTFAGIQRRFEYILERDDVVIIDDYAHHPKEIDAAILAARDHHPDKKMTVVFQPHLYSRTRDFMHDFALSLSRADEIVLVDLYPAREKPIPGINSEELLEIIDSANKSFVPKSSLVQHLNEHRPELILLLGAGDVYKMIGEIKAIYTTC